MVRDRLVAIGVVPISGQAEDASRRPEGFLLEPLTHTTLSRRNRDATADAAEAGPD
jgi:hypothetical protein